MKINYSEKMYEGGGMPKNDHYEVTITSQYGSIKKITINVDDAAEAIAEYEAWANREDSQFTIENAGVIRLDKVHYACGNYSRTIAVVIKQ